MNEQNGTIGRPQRFRLYFFPFNKSYYLIRLNDSGVPQGMKVFNDDTGSMRCEPLGEMTQTALIINLRILARYKAEFIWIGKFETEEQAVKQMRSSTEVGESIDDIVEAYSINKMVGKDGE